MKTLLLSLIFLITLNDCSNDISSAPFVPVTITTVFIGKEFTYDTVTPNNLVKNNQTDWDAFLLLMNLVLSSFINTNVDFNTYQVIAIVDSPKPNSLFHKHRYCYRKCS